MKKNILFIVSGIAYSGAEKVLEDYIDKTKKVTPYFLFYFEGDAYEHFKKKYSNVFLASMKYNKYALAFFPFIYNNIVEKNILKIKEKNKINKVFFNNTLEGLLGRKYMKKYNDCVYEIHDMRNIFKVTVKRMMIDSTIKICQSTVTVSEACKKSWNNKIKYVIYNGINLRNDKTSKDKDNIITYIGNSTLRKGPDICLAVAKYFENCKNLKFNMIFSDKIPEYNFSNNIKTYCKLDRKKVLDVLEESKIMFLPTRSDPFPTVILEGELCEAIIVSNNIDGIPEMVPTKNFLANNNEKSEYIEIINKILKMDKKELNKNISEQNKYIKKFDIEYKVKKFDEILVSDL